MAQNSGLIVFQKKLRNQTEKTPKKKLSKLRKKTLKTPKKRIYHREFIRFFVIQYRRTQNNRQVVHCHQIVLREVENEATQLSDAVN